ncbi:MAG TPA: hypothetical protein PKK00_06270 [Bacteroidales bacterium]|nr:hypothetical protein [Bacteroidales bacterium]HPS16895.1 hypothetical protein [Bacteroidales bacterium]
MYDTVEMIINRADAGNINLIEHVTPLLKKVNMSYYKDNDRASWSGYADNLKVIVSENYIKIKDSSLCKYYHGNNFETLTREETKLVIEKISDFLHLPMHKADVNRIDFATNFIMLYDLSFYMNRLGYLQYYQRLEQSNGLYYNNSKTSRNILKQLVFYNKVADYKAKGLPIPEYYENKNVLRYEIRFLKYLLQQFNLPKLKAAKLYDEKFFALLLKIWKAEYKRIRKAHDKNKFDFSQLKSIADYYQQGSIALNILNGGEVKTLKKIAEAQKKGMNRKLAFDIRKKAREAAHSDLLTIPSDYIVELNEKIDMYSI